MYLQGVNARSNLNYPVMKRRLPIGTAIVLSCFLGFMFLVPVISSPRGRAEECNPSGKYCSSFTVSVYVSASCLFLGLGTAWDNVSTGFRLVGQTVVGNWSYHLGCAPNPRLG